MPLPLNRTERFEAFAVEDTSVQLIWRARGPATITLAGRTRTVDEHLVVDHHLVGSAVIDGLAPSTDYHAEIRTERATGTVAFRTLASPPGRLLSRVATISDLHIGQRSFGLVKRRRERPEPEELHPVRCAQAAIDELVDWGAELLVVKGDLTHHQRHDDWLEVGKLLDRIPIPNIAIVGNHDVMAPRQSIPTNEGLALIGRTRIGVEVIDLEGVRLITADASVDGKSKGDLTLVRNDIIAAAAETTQPVLLAMHFHIHRFSGTYFWPPGLNREHGQSFLSELEAANPRVLLTSGHTHRHRLHRYRSTVMTEVGSTKDFPGVWAGYAVHEGGIRQIVRRTERPDVIGWTEPTRRAVGGVWGLWSVGTLDQRCFTHSW
ncbi:MAG: hypothetical protein HKN26_10675 [Acidimicrobiales bacterium]|nr:hypothetical protein [Acidimicrobiales bacterium]